MDYQPYNPMPQHELACATDATIGYAAIEYLRSIGECLASATPDALTGARALRTQIPVRVAQLLTPLLRELGVEVTPEEHTESGWVWLAISAKPRALGAIGANAATGFPVPWSVADTRSSRRAAVSGVTGQLTLALQAFLGWLLSV